MLRYVKRNAGGSGFERPDDMPEALYRLLLERGIRSAAEAEAFLHPGVRDLLDPMLLSDMGPASERIRDAVEAGEAICVYGDYDVDGVCASAILLMWLQSRGANAQVYLPSRHTEGYGLNEGAIREIAGWAKLMVTVDCGVTSVALVRLAQSLGLDVVVTDHHRPVEDGEGFSLPPCPVVNPLLNGYPFPHLCGAGVAWKLVWALSGELPLQFVDIAALATVADVVSLTGENRALVRLGLDRINADPRPGIAALIEAAGISGKPVTSTAIAFQLAPRLNAGGRLDTALRPLRLVTSTDPAEARSLAEELDDANAERRQIEQQILREAEAQLQDFDFLRHRALILSGADWNPGVIGLAASRLVEKYHYPVVMLADQGEKMTGSCRSIEGVDIHAALTGCADHLERFGGHRQAAGLTLLPEKLPGFIDAMDAWLSENVAPEAYIPCREYDAEIDLEAVEPLLVAALEAVQPTGFGNPAPVFRAQAEVIEARAVGAENAHLKLTLSQDGHRRGGIAFREGPRAEALREGSRVDVLFAPKLNTYMGRTTAQLEVRALAEAEADARLRAKLGDEITLQCDFLTEILYNKKIDFMPDDGVEAADMEQLAAWTSACPQGTLILAGDLAGASRLVHGLPEPDLLFGALPEDPRAFNAVCVCPAGGDIPGSYRRVVLAGVPVEVLAGRLHTGCRVYRLEERPGWTHCLPDLDGLRRAWRALADISRRPVRFRTLGQLAHLMAAASGLDILGALAALLALLDMELFAVDFESAPPRLRRLDRRKAEPEESAVWRAIQRWRTELL